MPRIERTGQAMFEKHDLASILRGKQLEIDQRVRGMPSEEAASASIADFVVEMAAQYGVESLVLDRENLSMDLPREARVRVYDIDNTRKDQPGTAITVRVPFTGTHWLFSAHGSAQRSISPVGDIQSQTGPLLLTYLVPESLAGEDGARALHETLNRDLEDFDWWISAMAPDVAAFNAAIKSHAEAGLRKRQAILAAGSALAAALEIPLARTEPERTRVLHPQPRAIALATSTASTPTPEWHLRLEDFDYILSLMEQMVLVMEKSPSTFAQMKEESLRDILLVILNAHFKGQATAETFNHRGKTDILLRYEGRNAFVGECKFWGGSILLQEAIGQLLGYTGWRDTKAALVIFNKNKNLSRVLEAICATVRSHAKFRGENPARSETHLRFRFEHPEDDSRSMDLAVMVFDMPDST